MGSQVVNWCEKCKWSWKTNYSAVQENLVRCTLYLLYAPVMTLCWLKCGMLVHFLIISRPNISCVRFMRKFMSMYFMILLSVLVFYFHSFVNMCACHVYF